jgi:hypothetical protein
MHPLFTLKKMLLAFVVLALSLNAYTQTETQNPNFPYWKTRGNNTITTPATPGTYGSSLIGPTENWLGTTDDNDVVIGTDNTERLRILQTSGYVGIGTATPNVPLMVRTTSITANARVTSLANSIGDPAFQLITTRGATTNLTGDITMEMGQTYGAAANVSEGIRFFRGTSGTNGAIAFITTTTERARILNNGNIGIATPTANTLLDINGDLALREGSAVAVANGVNGTIAPGASSHVRITGATTAFSIAGLTGGFNGKIITLINTTTANLTLLHNSAATLANGFFTPSGVGYVVAGQYSSVTLIYNSTLSRWIVKAAGGNDDQTDWNLVGNTGTNDPAAPLTYGTSTIVATENWIGTTDANDFVLGTNSIERMRVRQTTGNVGIGTAAPAHKLDILASGNVIGLRLLSGNTNELVYLSLGRTTEYAQIGAATAGTFFSDAASGDMAIKNFNTGKILLGASFVSNAAMSIVPGNRVGVGNVAPNTVLDLTGDFAMREGTALALIDGANGTIAPGATSHVRITGPTAAFSIAGITGGVNGKVITLINTTTSNLTLLNNSAATVVNGFFMPGNTPLVLDGQYSAVTLIYNATLARWVVHSNNSTGGDWHIIGNANIDSATNFLGTINAVPVNFRTNNQNRVLISSNGYVGIGTTTPGDRLTITSTATNAWDRRLRIGAPTTLNQVESGRLTFEESVSIYSGTANYCGIEFRHDGSVNSLFLEGGCTAPINIMTFERTGDVGINTADPTQALEIGGTSAQIYMNSATSNMLYFNSNGVALPAFTTRSAGTKLVYYPQVSATSVDYATGIESGTLWNSIPLANSGHQFNWYAATTELMRLRGDGRLGIGTTNPLATRLHCYDPSTATVRVATIQNNDPIGTEMGMGSIEYWHDYSSSTDFNNGFNTSGFTINFGASATFDLQLQNNSAAKPTSNAWTIASDERLKEDIQPFKDGLEVLEKINPVYWKYNGKAHTPANEYGVGIIAQEMKKIAPYTISTMEYVSPDVPFEQIRENIEQYYAYNSGPLEYVVVNSVKELSQKQKNTEQLLANTSEFGSATLTSTETEISYPAAFVQRSASVPVVTVSTINSSAQLTITGKSATGFKVKVLGDLVAPVDIDWIAVAKTNTAVLELKKDYTPAERQEMLSKVKLTPGKIRLEAEEKEMQRRKIQSDIEKKEAEQQSLTPVPKTVVPATKTLNADGQ